jgi:very-short-patch-repair endonuclease
MPAETRVDPNNSGQLGFGWIDRVIGALAERQHGVVSGPQLLHASVDRHVIDHKLRVGRLLPIHRGVYAVGHRRLTRRGWWMAAVLAAGPGAVLSHRAAAALHGIWHYDGLEVTAAADRSRPGITVHKSCPPADEDTELEGIPVTGLSRTLLDLAAVLPAHHVERAFNEAEVRGLTDSLSLPDLVERYPGRRGIRAIKAILETGPAFTRSELEARFTAFRRKTRLPSPSLNAVVEGYECDCVWLGHRLVVELDGRAIHATQAAFERDRARDRALTAAGWRVVRVTWGQLHDEPEALAADLRRILRPSRSAAPRSARVRAAGP